MKVPTKSPHYVRVDGQSFAIEIRQSGGDGGWRLEIVNDRGETFVSDKTYASEEAALDVAIAAFKDAGAAGFS